MGAQSMITKRATAIGYGLKFDFTQNVKEIPPPNAYSMQSSFDDKFRKGKIYSFGSNKSQNKIERAFNVNRKHVTPGPGQYESSSMFVDKQPSKWTMSPKIERSI